MKPVYHLLVLFMILPILHSCHFIHFMATKEPGDESEKQVVTYLEKHRFHFADYNLFLTDSLRPLFSDSLHALDRWKFDNGKRQAEIQIQVYDSTGNLVNGYGLCYGYYERLDILATKELRFFPQLPTNYRLKLANQPVLWEISDGQKEAILKEAPQNKYTFVVYWNIWSNHYSEVILKSVRKYLKKYESDAFKVLVILVNTGIKPQT